MSDQKTEQKPDHEKRIREALEAGPTEGEWRRGNAGASIVSDQPVEHGPLGCDCVEYYGGHLIAESINSRNLAYIAACNPSAIRALLADLDAARAALSEAKAGGWVAVPVEPTPQMTWAATVTADREWCYHVGRDDAKKLWAAMLAARPLPAPPAQKDNT